MAKPRTCPDCQSEMRPIKLINQDSGGCHGKVQYTSAEAKKGWCFYPVAGNVGGMMCSSCGRIVLYGEPS